MAAVTLAQGERTSLGQTRSLLSRSLFHIDPFIRLSVALRPFRIQQIRW